MKRLLPLAVLAAAMALFFALDLHRYVTFEALKTHRHELLAWYADHRLLAVAAYVVAYAAIVALSIPGATGMSLLGGFLFGTVIGAACTISAATIGALLIFLAARYAFADFFERRAGPFVRRMEQGFREDAMSYLLFLRLVPLFPFWLVNLVPAFLNVRVSTFVIATFFGIAPASVVISSVGSGLGAVIDAGRTPDLDIVTRPAILGPLVGLALLSLIPALVKRFRKPGPGR